MSLAIELSRLRECLGLRVRYRGEECTVIEVLDEPPCLVLEAVGRHTMMEDIHGRPFEYGTATHTLPVLNEERNALSLALQELEILA
ncbi:MAG: hypothetical protein AB1831_15870 [Pseudomonadota bacterium]